MPDDARWPLEGISQRLPPCNLEAEAALLGALLHNNRALDRVADFLAPEHFADPENGRIYQVLTRRVSAGQVVDAVTLKGECDPGHLATALGRMVGIINVPEYARAIHNAWLSRQMIDIGETVVNNAFTGIDGGEQVSTALEAVLALSERGGSRSAVSHADALARAVEHAGEAHRAKGKRATIETGIPAVDAIWRGLWPGELYYLLARSGTGKTPFMMQVARHVASQITEGCVHVFSLEMPAENIARLGIAANSSWSLDDLKEGRIGDAAEWMELDRIRDKLSALPIEIDDQAGLDLAAIETRARVVRRQKGTRLVCIDYREMIERPRDLARMQLPEWIPYLGNRLKALAKTLGCPVLALTQINKSTDARENNRPSAMDIPYCRGQAADASFALHRPELLLGDIPPKPPSNFSEEKKARAVEDWHKEREAARGVAEFYSLRRRSGPTGSCRLRFDGPRQLFLDVGRDNGQ